MSNWTFLYLAAALVAGMTVPLQTGFNTQLGRALQGPLYSTLAVFAVAFLTLLLAIFLTRTPVPSLEEAATAPATSWFAGGLLGAAYVLSINTLAPRVGSSSTVAFVVTGQLLCSTLIDHFGLLGFAVRVASPLRLLGLALIVAGVTMVRML